MQMMIEEFVSWTMFSRYAKSFWNRDCDEITKETRRLRRIWFATHEQHDWSNYMKSIDRKHKIINKVKKLNFREEIEKAVDTFANFWRLVHWAKNKSHSFKKILKMLVLKFDDQTINTFDEKIDMFRNLFFFAFFSTNFSDIECSFYLIAKNCSMIIIESEIIKIINRIAFDKISSFDEITNKMIKTYSEILTRLLISLF